MIATVKIAMLVWSREYLSEIWHIPPIPEVNNYWISMGMLSGFLVAGWCSDKFFCGRRWNANVLFHLGMVFLLLAFWLIPANIIVNWHSYLLYGIVYFFIIGIQLLIFVTAVELSPEKIRGTVAGFIMVLTFIAPGFANVPIGIMIDKVGWNCFFFALCGCVVLSTLAVWFCRPVGSEAE